jgi:hypothetical protein
VQLINYLLAARNGRTCEINTREAAFWKAKRHGNDIATVATAEFQNAALVGGRGRHPEENRQSRQMVRMR